MTHHPFLIQTEHFLKQICETDKYKVNQMASFLDMGIWKQSKMHNMIAKHFSLKPDGKECWKKSS